MQSSPPRSSGLGDLIADAPPDPTFPLRFFKMLCCALVFIYPCLTVTKGILIITHRDGIRRWLVLVCSGRCDGWW